MIIITRSFAKGLSAFSPSVATELASLISKHSRGLEKSLVLINRTGTIFVYKGYLDGKRVRMTVAKTPKGNYVPLEILKKESKRGYNLRSDYDAARRVDAVNREIAEGAYETWDFTR